MDDAIKVELERLRDEDQRQNRRLDALENITKEIHTLALSIRGMAKDMEQMLKEQRGQRERLDDQERRIDVMEREPAAAWKDAKKTLVAAVISTIAGGLATGLIFILSQSL